MPDRISKLVDSVNRVGIRNVALLSRLTGIPIETVRYMLKKTFREIGLSVGLQVDYDRLGLERNFAVLDFSSDSFDYAHELLKKLASVSFLTYQCREVLQPRYIATFGVPVVRDEHFNSFLRRLVKEKVLQSFKLEKLEWTRHLALRSEYYDFKKKKWAIDWGRVGALKEPPPAPPLAIEPLARPQIDMIDILLIKELELQSWRHLSDIAKKLGINDRTARWHYSKHVYTIINSYFVHRLQTGSKELTKVVGLIYEFNHMSRQKLQAIRRLFNNFPFTWNEGGRKDGYYLVVLTVPSDNLIESMQFLTTHLQKNLVQWVTYTLDLTTSQWYTIPYENFNDKVGWFFDAEKALHTILSIQMKKKG